MLLTDSAETVLAAIATYCPDAELLDHVLCSIVSQVNEVLIVDNASSNVDEIRNLAFRFDARFISFRENRGIAAAFNTAFCYAKEEEYKWVITCDQDSVIPSGAVTRFLSAEESFVNKMRPGIVCPNFYNRTTKRLAYSGENPRLIDCCISSGSLTLVSAWSEISGFDEDMFIDGVDFEFCDRLLKSGYGVLIVPDVHMEHEIGTASLHGFPGHEFLVLNHPPFRKFYIAQNIIYRDGKGRGGRATMVAYLKVLKQALLVALYEKDKTKKLIQILEGTISGRKLLAKARRGI